MEVWRDGGLEARVPLTSLDVIVVSTGAATVSVRLLQQASEHGIPLYVVDSRGRAVSALLPAEPSRSVDGSLWQAMAYLDQDRRLAVARGFVEWKIRGRAWLLKRLSRSWGAGLRESALLLERDARRAANSGLEELLAVEAHAGRIYWEALRSHTPLGGAGFERREPRAGDPWNTALDYLYSLLRGLAHRALILAGLNPYLGFLHALRPGKPSLTLDYMEAYRWLAEWALLKLSARGWAPILTEDGRLAPEARTRLLSAWDSMAERSYPGSNRSVEKTVVGDAWLLRESFRTGEPWAPTRPGRW